LELDLVIIRFEDNEISRRDTPKIRGYIAANFPEYIELHHHNNQGYVYRYPLIQYKTINKKPMLVGIGKGAEILINIETDIKKLNIDGEIQQVYQKSIKYQKVLFGVSESLISYKFLTPWMALNQENYRKYINTSITQRRELLHRILIGNLISMSKWMQYDVKERLYSMVDVKPVNVNFKNNKMIAFKGNFTCNFLIPDYLGLGKSVSRGFGTVLKINNTS
jgi:hypothetical protein